MSWCERSATGQEQCGRKIDRIPSGHGMALIFFQSAEEPVHWVHQVADGTEAGECRGIATNLAEPVMDWWAMCLPRVV
jgi:hypothetical protein